MLCAANTDFFAFHAQRFVQWHRLKVLDRHLACESDDVVELVHLAHGVVEDGGDDASVAVSGRASVAFAEAELADEGLALFVENELQVHAIGIVLAASEAVVLLEPVVGGFVSVNLGWHGRSF